MDYLVTFQAVVEFIKAHWEAILVFITGMGAVVAALGNKAYTTAFTLAMNLVREAAIKELSGEEKRKWVANELFKVLPLWAKILVPNLWVAEQLVERVYQFLKGELKPMDETTK